FSLVQRTLLVCGESATLESLRDFTLIDLRDVTLSKTSRTHGRSVEIKSNRVLRHKSIVDGFEASLRGRVAVSKMVHCATRQENVLAPAASHVRRAPRTDCAPALRCLLGWLFFGSTWTVAGMLCPSSCKMTKYSVPLVFELTSRVTS